MQAILTLVVLGGIIALLVSERLRPDVVAMLALAALVVLGLLPLAEVLSGFSSPATVTVACMFVLSAGLKGTGLVRRIADLVLRHGPSGEVGLLLLMVVTIAPISAFINNTAAVVVFLPIMIQACHGNGISPSRLLMPMVFLAILGGACTIIGTSTNILVSSMAADRGLRPFGMFELSPLGIIFLAVGVVYLLLVGRHLVPERVKAQPLTTAHHLERYLTELVVREDSPLAGTTLAEADLGERHQIEVLGVVGPTGEMEVVMEGTHRLAPGEVLVVKAPATALLDLHERTGLDVRPGQHPDTADLRSLESALVEVVVLPGSALEGATLKEADFQHRYDATALAIRRRGEELLEKIGRVRLWAGDELLVLARRSELAALRQESDFVALQELDVPVLRPWRAATALAIVTGVVASAAMGWLPIVGSALVGSVLMILTGCLPLRKVYESVDWHVVILLAGVIPLGVALERSGAAGLIVRTAMAGVGDLGPRAVLGGFVVLTYLLTGVMSNNATAAVMFPLALSTAEALDVSSRPLLVAIMFAASAAFYTPFGYQTNLLVYGPGGYRFTDYTRIGGPLNAIYLVLSVILIPRLFPF